MNKLNYWAVIELLSEEYLFLVSNEDLLLFSYNL